MKNAVPQNDDVNPRDLTRLLRLVPRKEAARPPQLSDAELIQIREMMVKVDKVLNGCPVAQRILLDP